MRNSAFIAFIAITLLLCFSCQDSPKLSEDMQKVADQKSAYEANPNKETAAGYLAAVSLYSGAHRGENKTKELLMEASKIAKKEGQNLIAASMSNELIKQFPDDGDNKSRLIDLANTMQTAGKRDAAANLKYFLTKKYPEFSAKNGIVLPGGMPENVDTLIKMRALEIFGEGSANGLDRNASFRYVDAVEAYAMVYNEKIETPKYLFHAAEVSRTLGTIKKSLSLYDWILAKYPDDENAPKAMFLKGFILENDLNNLDGAKEVYTSFIESYPSHEFASAAEFSLNNLGKTDAEMQAELERLQKENAGK